MLQRGFQRAAVGQERHIHSVRALWLSGRQPIEQRLSLLQIERTEAFGEPAVGWSEQFACLYCEGRL